MERVTPEVFHLGGTTTDYTGLLDFLAFHSVPDLNSDAESQAELLIEVAGRRCYQSWQTETVNVSEKNPNLSKVRKGNKTYINNILKVGHGSVIEHAVETYAVENVTRVFTHEVVRHRLCAFSQESLRFVRPTSLNAYFPDIFTNLPNESIKEPISDGLGGYWNPPETVRDIVQEIFEGVFKDLETIQQQLIDVLGMDEVSRGFSDKKKLQSAMRRLMPIGMATGIIITTNHRNWRHLIALRTASGAEEEIRKVFGLIAEDLVSRCPALYQDMTESNGEYSFEHGRV